MNICIWRWRAWHGCGLTRWYVLSRGSIWSLLCCHAMASSSCYTIRTYRLCTRSLYSLYCSVSIRSLSDATRTKRFSFILDYGIHRQPESEVCALARFNQEIDFGGWNNKNRFEFDKQINWRGTAGCWPWRKQNGVCEIHMCETAKNSKRMREAMRTATKYYFFIQIGESTTEKEIIVALVSPHISIQINWFRFSTICFW